MEKNRVDSEYLISTIRKYESIWNKNAKEYHKKSSKEAAWNEVCEDIIEGWNSLSEEEKSTKQFELKKRWNNIRDYFKKDLALERNGNIGQGSMIKRKKYVYSQKLEFLIPVLDNSTYRKYEKASDDEFEEQEVYLEDMFSSDSESPPKKRKELIRMIEDNNTTSTSTVLEVAPSRRTQSLEDDCDWLFLRSLLPDMKMMNRSQKFDFKLGMLKLYKDIMTGNQECDNFAELESKNPLK